MNISISIPALTDSANIFNFRKESLWALKSMQNMGHSIQIDSTSLNEEQLLLLDQEGIHLNAIETPDLIIHEEGSVLNVRNAEQITLTEGDSWSKIVRFIQFPPRISTINRNTNETKISIELNLDGTGKSRISTGLNFFDHMLEQIARHGLIDLDITCKGDLEIDEHHTIEDVAIALGSALTEAIGDKKGIDRYGFVLAMDEAKATVAIDLSGRPYLVFDGTFNREYVGDMPTEMVKHFFYSLAMNLKATLNISFEGENDHHKIEACFKGLARALKSAIEQNPRILTQVPSSKGLL